MILRARIRPKVDDGQRRDLRVEAADYYAARDMLDEQTPDGWTRMPTPGQPSTMPEYAQWILAVGCSLLRSWWRDRG